MNTDPLSVLIIGCGNIAGIFDQGRDSEDLPFTHAGAFSRDDRFTITACVEPDHARRRKFMENWEVPRGAASVDEFIVSNEKFDVISICSPTSTHAQDIEKALLLRPKLIFCEKPVTISLSETERLVDECCKADVPLAVNYTRRWDPDVSKLKADILADSRGQLRSITGTYNKGILNNGSHMLDLLHMLVGSVEIVKVGRPVFDFFEDDPTIPVWLQTDKGLPIYLTCGHAKDYSLFELQLVFSQGVLTMEDGGMFWRERQAIDSETFAGYKQLGPGERRVGEYPRAMIQAIDNIYNTINLNETLSSTGESALVAQRLCADVKHLACSD